MTRWQETAPCNGMTKLFFPSRGGPHRDTARAIAICNTCPHIEPCLELGMKWPQTEHGIYGGTTPGQRAIIRRNRQAAA